MNRYKCENQIYTLTDIAVEPKKGKDRTEYEFEGKKYKKGRLVLAMIKYYVEKNYNKLNATELKSLLHFSGKTYNTGGKPILMDYKEAVEISNRPNSNGNIYRYYFIKPEEAIVFSDGTKLAVLDWWSKYDIPTIKKIAEVLGCKIQGL